jgi:alkylation response protein AidB-like acyl-CoA dehydrogenase
MSLAATQYHPNTEQRSLIAAFERPIEALLPLARVHRSWQESGESWRGLAALGLFGLTAAEEEGGSGLGAAEEALTAKLLGRRLAAPSVLASLACVHCGAPNIARRIVDGGLRVAAAWTDGTGTHLVDDPASALVLVRTADRAAIHEVAAIAAREAADEYLWSAALADIRLTGAPLNVLDAAALRHVRLIDAAALCGIAEAATEMAVGYAKVREQFGRPIGAFQAVKHHCANMALAARAAGDQTSFAATAIDQGRPDAAFQVEAALLLAIEAAIANSGLNIQVHGGIGYSDEADPHLLLKRAQLLATLAGGAAASAARLAALPPVFSVEAPIAQRSSKKS